MNSRSPAPIAKIETFIGSYAVTGHFKFFPTGIGRRPQRDTVLVKITDDRGRIGWGQSIPSPTWSYETIETVQTTIDRHLAPALLGVDAFATEEIWRIMNRVIAPAFSTGQPIAKAGIDLALFDLTGRIQNHAAHARWNRPPPRPVTLSWTIDPRTLDEVGASIAAAKGRGFHNFNVKVGRDAAFDLEVCREIRRLAADAFVWVDANGGYSLATALKAAPQFADLGIAALEQPLPANRLTGYQQLVRQGALPILMDESIVSLADLETFHQLGMVQGVAMKVSRCGGLTEARRIIEYIREHGLHFFASGLTDPDVAFAACLLLFSAYELPHPAALNAPQFLEGTFLRTPLAINGDQATPPAGAGLGVQIDEALLQRPEID